MIKVLVLGAGAVGLGLSSFLLQSGCSVTIVGKKEIVDLLRGKGLSRIGIFGELYSPPGTFCAYSNLNDISPVISNVWKLFFCVNAIFYILLRSIKKIKRSISLENNSIWVRL